VKKTARSVARSATRVIAGEQGAQRSVVVERRVIRRFGNDKRTIRRSQAIRKFELPAVKRALQAARFQPYICITIRQ